MGSDFSASVQVVSRLIEARCRAFQSGLHLCRCARRGRPAPARHVSPQAAASASSRPAIPLDGRGRRNSARAFRAARAKVPKRRIPISWCAHRAVRPAAASVLSALSNRSEYSGAKRGACSIGSASAREAIIDCAESLLEKGCCEPIYTFHSIPLTRKGPTHLSSTPTAPSSGAITKANHERCPHCEAASASNGNSSAKSCIIILLYRLRALRNDHKP